MPKSMPKHKTSKTIVIGAAPSSLPPPVHCQLLALAVASCITTFMQLEGTVLWRGSKLWVSGPVLVLVVSKQHIWFIMTLDQRCLDFPPILQRG